MKAAPALVQGLNGFLNLCFPPVCLHCHEQIPDQTFWLCGNCQQRLQPVPEAHCPKCGCPSDTEACPNCAEMHYAFDRAVSLYLYEGAIKTVIHNLKYSGFSRIADWLANIAFQTIQADTDLQSVDMVCPVPLHRVRQRERGYNQSALIARAMAVKLQKPFQEHILVKNRNTASQTAMSRTARLSNVRGSFRMGKSAVRGKRILLVDDVFTTGSTVNEASRTLRAAGAAQVFVLTICHGA